MNKLTKKDFITVGTFTTLLFVVKLIVGILGLIPIFNVFLPAITAIVVAPIYIIFIKKVDKFGMITMMSMVLGGLSTVLGYGIYAFIGSTILGLIADFITKKGDYKDIKYIRLGYGFQVQWGVTKFINILILGQAYYDKITPFYGEEFVAELQKFMPWHCILWMPIVTFFAAYLGMFLCKNMLKRHLEAEVDDEADTEAVVAVVAEVVAGVVAEVVAAVVD